MSEQLRRETLQETVDMKFMDFVLKYEGEWRETFRFLQEPIPKDTAQELMNYISIASSKLSSLVHDMVTAEYHVINAKSNKMPQKEAYPTVLVQNAELERRISQEVLIHSYLSQMAETMNRHLSSAQSLLSYKRAELQRFGQGE